MVTYINNFLTLDSLKCKITASIGTVAAVSWAELRSLGDHSENSNIVVALMLAMGLMVK